MKTCLLNRVTSIFAIHKFGEPQDFLGIEIARDRDAGLIIIDQARKCTALAVAMGVAGEPRRVLDTFAGLVAAQAGDRMADVWVYQSAIGSSL